MGMPKGPRMSQGGSRWAVPCVGHDKSGWWTSVRRLKFIQMILSNE